MAATVTLTGSQFDALPYEDGRRWELLDGELIPVSSPTPERQLILQRILLALMIHLRANPGQGLALTDVEFALDENYRVRPDVLVLLHDRAHSLDMKKIPVPGAPDLAIEIISPSERSSDTQEKLQAYLRYGTREVWQVYPKSRSVVVYRGGESSTLADGELSTPLLEGFSWRFGRFSNRRLTFAR
ncbi:MAG TPA: Uma2 family endonuclease [Verrucomicrobiae bacterium]|nr:Uma2 family endonuclease [Verrucomicrobiae bacterium]